MTSTDKTADELRDLAARTYRTCVERQRRIAKRDEEARRAHTAILARCDEVERELRELRDDHIETLAHLVACVEALGLPRDTDGPALVEAVRARALPRAEVRDADVVERSFYDRDRAAWSERAKRAESQLALAMAWGAKLVEAEGRAECLERENRELRDQASAYNELAERFRAAEARARAAENRAPERERVSVVERRATIDGAPHEVLLGAPMRGCLITTPDPSATAMVLADFLESLGHDVERVEADEPASLAVPDGWRCTKPSAPSETITITLLKEGDRVMANRGSRREPGTITKVERAGPDGWRCSIYFDEGSGVSWYGPREVAPLAPEHDPRNRTEDT
jgi:hypothetical protein